MSTVTSIVACIVFLLAFVGLPIIGIAWLIINHVDNKRNKQYFEWIEHVDDLEKGHIHYTR